MAFFLAFRFSIISRSPRMASYHPLVMLNPSKDSLYALSPTPRPLTRSTLTLRFTARLTTSGKAGNSNGYDLLHISQDQFTFQCACVCACRSFEKGKQFRKIRHRWSSTIPLRTNQIASSTTRWNPMKRRQKTWPMRSLPNSGEFPHSKGVDFLRFLLDESSDRALRQETISMNGLYNLV